MKPTFRHPLDPLFNPQSIAVFGATEKSGQVGHYVFANLQSSGFRGQVFAINPKRENVLGAPCFPDLKSTKCPVDLVIVCTPQKRLKTVLAQCEERGVLHALLLSHASDEETDPGIDALINRSPMRILGPNSAGVIRPWLNLNASYLARVPPRGSLAVISQSASLCSAISDWATPNHLGVSALISVGDGTDVKLGEVIEFCADDPKTEAILLYVDRIHDGAAFVSSLRYATWRKPVVVLKPYATAVDATEDAVFDAVLSRTGAVRAKTFGQMFAAAEILASGREARGPTLALVSNSHAAGNLATDRATSLGLSLTQESEASENTTKSKPRRNNEPATDAPFRVFDHADCADVFQATLKERATNGLLAMYVPKPGEDPQGVADRLIAAAKSDPAKPVLACWMGDASVAKARTALSAAGIPDFDTPEGAVDAFYFLSEHARQQDLALEVPGPRMIPNIDESVLKHVVTRALSTGRSALNEGEAKQILSAVELPIASVAERAKASKLCKLHVARTPTFGVFFELLGRSAQTNADAAYAIPPLTSVLARRLIERSRVGHDSLVQILIKMSDLVCTLPQIWSLKTTLILDEHDSVLLSDVELSIREQDPSRPHLSVAPYPSHLETKEKLEDGTVLVIRPIRAEDAQQEDAFVSDLSPKSRQLRFFGAIRSLSSRQLVRFTQLDFSRELALVAVLKSGAPNKQIAVARYYILPSGKDAEFAIAVHDDYHRKGIATKLMHQLYAAAKDQGIERFHGAVLSENKAMLRLARSLGCKDYIDAREPDVVQVELPLV